MKLTLWRPLIIYSLSLVTYLQVTADDQMILSDVTNTSNEWFEWSEENSLGDAYWTLCDDVILLNTTSGNGTAEQQYSLLSPSYTTLTNNCNISISYTRQAEITIEVIVRPSDGDNVTLANMNGTIGEIQAVTLPVNISQSIAQLIFSVTTNLNDELLSIDSINISDCSDVVSLTSSVVSSLMIITESTTIDLLQTSSTGIFTSLDGSGMLSFSSSQFNVPPSSTTSSILVVTSELLSTITISSSINTIDIVSVTSSLLPVNMSTAGITSLSTPSAILSTTTLASISTTSNIVTSSSSITSSPITSLSITSSSITSSSLIGGITVSSSSSVQPANSTSLMMIETPSSLSSGDITPALSTLVTLQSTNVQSPNTSLIMTETPSPSVIISTTNISPPTTLMPSSSNASESSGDTNFFSTNVIIGIAAGGGTLLLILLCLLICCLYRICVSQRNQQQKYLISNNTGYKNSHKGHSSVYAQERYRHKSRSVESMNGPYQYEMSFVPVEAPPEAYVCTNGDEDTIDSESEDIRRDLKGTPTSSHPESQSAADHEAIMTSFYPQTDAADHQWSDYSSDNNDDETETSSDMVYPNKSLVNDMYSGELPPILSLGDYEDDENVVIINPYNYPTIYSDHIPNKDTSPRRTATTKSNINLEALTTLESSGEYTDYAPKPCVPNYRRKQSRYAAGKNHKLLRKTKSELNLEDATKITGATRYPKHQSKSRIDLKEATKLATAGHSDVARVNHHHRRPHQSSTPRILDSSSKLEQLTSLDTY